MLIWFVFVEAVVRFCFILAFLFIVSCSEGFFSDHQKREGPRIPEILEIKKYGKDLECVPLPKPEKGKLVLGEGCFAGCVRAEKTLHISGRGAEKTMIVCNDEEKEAVVEAAAETELILEDVSVSGKVRCVFAENGSRITIKNSVLSHCVKGGVSVCSDEAGCRADLTVTGSFIGDIEEDASGISYGISFGNGDLNISASRIGGVNSFGVAVWGGTGNLNRINMENSEISGVYGGLRSYEGHGFYAENAADIVIRKSSISDTASSFIFLTSESDEMDLKLIDFTAVNMLETSEEQRVMVLDGRIRVFFERVSVLP